MQIRITTDAAEFTVTPEHPDDETLSAYNQLFRDRAAGNSDAASLYFTDANGSWTVIPIDKVVAIEGIPDPVVT